jgi:hypothetical protein
LSPRDSQKENPDFRVAALKDCWSVALRQHHQTFFSRLPPRYFKAVDNESKQVIRRLSEANSNMTPRESRALRALNYLIFECDR